MAEFSGMLEHRKDELYGDVFDLLMTLSSFDAFKDVYLQAYELGCKGCTTYRPNDVTGAVLETRKDGDALPLSRALGDFTQQFAGGDAMRGRLRRIVRRERP